VSAIVAVAPTPMTYWDEPSGFVPQADETVSVLAVLEDTVLLWPAPVPALIVTTRVFHWSAVHALVMSWGVVLACVMRYSDVASGIVVRAGETASASGVLGDTLLLSPAAGPALSL